MKDLDVWEARALMVLAVVWVLSGILCLGVEVLGEDTVTRMLERARHRREVLNGDEDDRIGAEKERLGVEVLRCFEGLVDDPEMIEGLRLYLGADVDPIRIHNRRFGVYWEEWSLDDLGRLVYELSGSMDYEASGAGVDVGLLNRRIVLCCPSDFRVLGIETVADIHHVARSEDFFIKLAWRYGRCGKPGFSPDGFEEERETWRLLAADPEDLVHLRRRWRRRGFSAG